MKTTKGKGVGARSLACSTSKVEGHAEASNQTQSFQADIYGFDRRSVNVTRKVFNFEVELSPYDLTKGRKKFSFCSVTVTGVKSLSLSRWGLRRFISKSITRMDLHKPNNKLVSAQLEHLWCTNEPWANTDSQDSP
jgi:hypothetical protein